MAILNANVPKGLRIYHTGECDLEPVCEWIYSQSCIPTLTSSNR